MFNFFVTTLSNRNSQKVSNSHDLLSVEGYWFLHIRIVMNIRKKQHERRIYAVKMKALRSLVRVTITDILRNSVIKDRCGVEEVVVTEVQKGMLRWFGHKERINHIL